MSAVSIFLLGTIALTNVALVGYLLAERNKTVNPPNERQPEQPPEIDKEQPQVEIDTSSRIGESKFNVDEFLKKFEQLEQGVMRMNKTLDRIEEDVKFKDVEFVNDEDKPSDEEIANESAQSNGKSVSMPQVESENLDKVFEDARIEEFDGDTVSSPSASGFTTEEIEESVNVASYPNSSLEAKTRAGRVLISLRGTNFEDALSSDEKIKNDLMECYRQNLRNEIADKNKNKFQKMDSSAVPTSVSKVVSSQPSQQVPPKKQSFNISENFDEFNPESLFK